MSIEDRIPDLQAALWKRLGDRGHLRPNRLLERLGEDMNLHPLDVRRGLARLRDKGWLSGVADNGEPLGNLTILAERPLAQPPETLARWTAVLEAACLAPNDQACLGDLHELATEFEQHELIDLALGLVQLRDEYRHHRNEPQFVVSARHLLASSKILGEISSIVLKRFLGVDPEWPDQIPYVVTAGPEHPRKTVLIENPWAFERAIAMGLAATDALIVTFGYGLSRNGDAFGRQLARQIEVGTDSLVQLRRHGNPPELSMLLQHPRLEFWGDLDPEGLRIYLRLKTRLPTLRLSPLYEPMRQRLLEGQGHSYNRFTAKAGQSPITPDELDRAPEIDELAQLCAKRGIDQEVLSADEIACHTQDFPSVA